MRPVWQVVDEFVRQPKPPSALTAAREEINANLRTMGFAELRLVQIYIYLFICEFISMYLSI